MLKKPLKILDQIHADDDLKRKTLQKIISKKQKKHANLWKIAVPVCVILLITGGIFTIHRMTLNKPSTFMETTYSYIAIDINPSFELELNEKNQIIDIQVYNEDAQEMLKTLSLQGKDYQEGVKNIVASLSNNAYLNEESYLQISVYSADEERIQQLESSITNYLDTTLSIPHDCMRIDEQTHHNAQECHMSPGRYNLVQEIMKYTSEYTQEELNSMNMAELRNYYYEIMGNEWKGSNHENCNENHQQKRKRNGHPD